MSAEQAELQRVAGDHVVPEIIRQPVPPVKVPSTAHNRQRSPSTGTMRCRIREECGASAAAVAEILGAATGRGVSRDAAIGSSRDCRISRGLGGSHSWSEARHFRALHACRTALGP